MPVSTSSRHQPRESQQVVDDSEESSLSDLPPEFAANTEVDPFLSVEAFLQQSFARARPRTYGSARKRGRRAPSGLAEVEQSDGELNVIPSETITSPKRARIISEESSSSSDEPSVSRRAQPPRAAKAYTQDVRMHVQQLKAKQKRSRVPLKLRLARAGRPRTKVVESDEDDPDFVEAPQPSSPVTPARRKTTRRKNGWAKDTLPAPSLFKMLPSAADIQLEAEIAQRAMERDREQHEIEERTQKEREGMRTISHWRSAFVVRSPGLESILNTNKGVSRREKGAEAGTGVKPLEFVSMREHEEGRKRVRDAREKIALERSGTPCVPSPDSTFIVLTWNILKTLCSATPSPNHSALHLTNDYPSNLRTIATLENVLRMYRPWTTLTGLGRTRGKARRCLKSGLMEILAPTTTFNRPPTSSTIMEDKW